MFIVRTIAIFFLEKAKIMSRIVVYHLRNWTEANFIYYVLIWFH